MIAAGINLLPWRRDRRQRQLKLLLTGFVGLMLLAIALGILSNGWLLSQSQALAARNDALDQRLALLQAPLAEARAIQHRLARFDARFQAIAKLENAARSEVQLFELLARELPDALRLTEIRKRDRQIEISGLALSNEAVSALMRRLEASALLESPQRLQLALQEEGLDAGSRFRLGLELADPPIQASDHQVLGPDVLAGEPTGMSCAIDAAVDAGGCNAR